MIYIVSHIENDGNGLQIRLPKTDVADVPIH